MFPRFSLLGGKKNIQKDARAQPEIILIFIMEFFFYWIKDFNVLFLLFEL